MSSNIDKLKKSLDDLIARTRLLYYALADDLGVMGNEAKKQLKQANISLPRFRDEYEKWYTEALEVVKQIIPERLDDFRKLYKDEKRKSTDFLTYTMSDYMIGLATTRGFETVVDRKAALPKFEQQMKILQAAEKRFESTLFNIRQLLQADLFDNELDSARELRNKGFLRGAGAVAGVVLESHLEQICQRHKLKIRKKNPSISDYNQILKDSDIIDIPAWRFIQHLADIRNLCDHKKKREPKPEEIDDLIDGADKVTKTVF